MINTQFDRTLQIVVDKSNLRIRVDDYPPDLDQVMTNIHSGLQPWVEKLIVKSRPQDILFFMSKGFSCEACIKGYFAGDDMFFMVKYLSQLRAESPRYLQEQEIVEQVTTATTLFPPAGLSNISLANESHAGALAELYQTIFEFYPTPIQKKDYVLETLPTAFTTAAFASKRVESSVGSDDASGATKSGISVQPSTTASQPWSPRVRITS